MRRRLTDWFRRRRKPAPKPPAVPTSHLVNAGPGSPSACTFCDQRATFVIVGMKGQGFACGEHVGAFIVDWTIDRELRVVRL